MRPKKSLEHRLGFVENSSLKSARRTVVHALRTTGPRSGTTQTAWQRYQALGESYVASRAPNLQLPSDVGFLIAKARIWRQSRYLVRYLTELQDAYEYAYQARLGDAPAIQGEIDRHYKRLKQILKTVQPTPVLVSYLQSCGFDTAAAELSNRLKT